MENVQQCINEYKEAASCFAYIRQHLSQSFSTVQMSWDMTDNGLLGVCVVIGIHCSLRIIHTVWNNSL